MCVLLHIFILDLKYYAAIKEKCAYNFILNTHCYFVSVYTFLCKKSEENEYLYIQKYR